MSKKERINYYKRIKLKIHRMVSDMPMLNQYSVEMTLNMPNLGTQIHKTTGARYYGIRDVLSSLVAFRSIVNKH